MHPILEEFLDKWVWPTMPGAPGAEFRLHLTKQKCLKGWEISLQRKAISNVPSQLPSQRFPNRCPSSLGSFHCALKLCSKYFWVIPTRP